MRHLLWLIALLLLAGCGSSKVRQEELPAPPDPDRFEGDAGVRVLWRAKVGDMPATTGYRLVPQLHQGRVYAAGARDVLALDAETGETLWKRRLDFPLSAGPGAGSSLIALGTFDGRVLGLSSEDGRLLWESGVTSEVLAVPRISVTRVAVRAADGRVFGLDTVSGRRQWLFERSAPVLTLRGTSSPVLAGGSVYVGLDTGKLAALDAGDGKLGWESTVALASGRSDLERMVDIDADPQVYRGEVYAVSYQGRLAALDAGSGQLRWERALSAHAGLAVDSEAVFVTDADNRVWGIDRRSGAALWRQDDLRGLALTGPAVFAEHVVVADDEGFLNWLSRRDGSIVQRQKIGGAPLVAPPQVAGGLLLAGAHLMNLRLTHARAG